MTVDAPAHPCLERSLDAELAAALHLDLDEAVGDDARLADRPAWHLAAHAHRAAHVRTVASPSRLVTKRSSSARSCSSSATARGSRVAALDTSPRMRRVSLTIETP